MGQIRRGISVIWDLTAPLLLYMIICDGTVQVWQIVSGGIAETQGLAAGGLGAAIAVVPLGIWYRKLRGERRRMYVQEERAGQEKRAMQEGRAVQEKRAMQEGSAGQESCTGRRTGMTAADVGTTIMLAVGFCIFLNNLLMLLDPLSAGFERAGQLLSGPSLAVQILSVGLVIPLAEELVFRGFAYERLREVLSVRGAVAASAVYFGLFHGNLVQGIYATVFGVILALLCERYDSLTAAWLFHGAANLTSILVTALGLQRLLAARRSWMAAAAAAGGILILYSAYKIKKGKKTT
ncbi:MAG: CPBP family intramembrane metalloprotease [Eubacteriales bacterium]|nr:CPBP family intramembrane metalloprotease [Eubacteriales bacterium]